MQEVKTSMRKEKGALTGNSRILLLLLVLCNIAIVTAVLLPCFHKEQITVEQGAFYRELDEGREYEEGFYVDPGYEGTGRIASKPLFLRRGFYSVTADLQVHNPHGGYGCYIAVVTDGARDDVFDVKQVESDRIEVFDWQDSVTFSFYVKYTGEYRVMVCLGEDMEDVYALLYGADLTYLRGRSVIFNGALMLLILLPVDLFILAYLLKREQTLALIRAHAVEGVGCLTILLLACYPCLDRKIFFNGDLWYHLNRIRFLAEGLASGTLPVRIHPGWAWDYGYAAGVFYADLLLLPSAILQLLGFTMNAAYKAHMIQMSAITVLTSFYTAKKITGEKLAALACSALYALSMYWLMMTSASHMVGQYEAYAFLPLVLLGLYGIYTQEKGIGYRIAFVAGLTGVIESHVITTFLLGVMTLFFMALLWRRTKQREVLLTLVKCFLATFLLNAYYLIPFLDYYLHQPIRGSIIAREMWHWSQNMMNILVRDGNYPFDGFTVGIVPLLIASLVLLMICGDYVRHHKDIYRTLAVLALFFFWAMTSLFPHYWMQRNLPLLYKIFKNIQFPGRYYTIAAILLFFLLTLSLKALLDSRRVQAAMIIPAVLCTLCLVQMLDYYHDLHTDGYRTEIYDEEAKLPIYVAEFMIEGSNTGTGQEHPTPEAENPEALIVSSYERNGTTYRVAAQNLTKTEQTLLIPLWAYRGYAARSNTGYLTVTESEDHRVQVAVPAGFDGELKVFFREPWYWRLSELITLATAFCLVWMIRRNRSARQLKTSQTA